MQPVAQFAVDVVRAVMTGDLNVIGQIAGIVGGVVVTIFGMPSLSTLSAAAYSEFNITPKIRLYGRLSTLGLLLVIAAFVCQLVATVHPMPHTPMTGSLADEWTAAMAFVSAILWGVSAMINIPTGFDMHKEASRSMRVISRFNAAAAAFAALAALIQAAKPLLVQ